MASAALLGALPSILQGIGSLGGNTPPGIAPVSLFTPEMQQQAINQFQNYLGNQEDVYGTPYAGPGGVTVSQAREIGPKEQKVEVYTDYLVNEKGLDRETARAQANEVVSRNRKNFNDDKGFLKYIRQGNVPGMKVKDGRIKTSTKYSEGGVQTGQASENLRGGFDALSGQAFGAASGLPGLFGRDVANSLASKDALRGGLMDRAMQNLQFDTETLSPGAQSDQGALEEYYMDKFNSLFKDTMQNATGELIDSGFSSSSLAGDVLQDKAYDSQSRFLTEAAASLANNRQNLLNNQQSRQYGQLGAVGNLFNTLGSTSNYGNITGSIMNPSQAGLFTDPQSAGLAAGMQQNNIGNRARDQYAFSDILTQPVDIIPSGGGDSGGGFLGLF